MEEKSLFVACDGALFLDANRCCAYEQLSLKLNDLISDTTAQIGSEEVSSVLDYVSEADSGEKRLDRMLALMYLTKQLCDGIPNADALFENITDWGFPASVSPPDWRAGYGGIAREIVDLPSDASEKEVGKVLRKYDTNQIAMVLEVLEESQISLRIYKIIRNYLSL